MPRHEVIDNRGGKLVKHVNRILGSTEAARFAVGGNPQEMVKKMRRRTKES